MPYSCMHKACRLVCWVVGQAGVEKKLAMADGTAVMSTQPSVGTLLPRGAELVKKPKNPQVFVHHGRQACMVDSGTMQTWVQIPVLPLPDFMTLGMNLSDPGFPYL